MRDKIGTKQYTLMPPLANGMQIDLFAALEMNFFMVQKHFFFTLLHVLIH